MGFSWKNGWRISNYDRFRPSFRGTHFLSGTMIMGERWRKGNHVLQWKMAPRKERIVLEERLHDTEKCVVSSRIAAPSKHCPPKLKEKLPGTFAPQNRPKPQIKKAYLPTTKNHFQVRAVGFRECIWWNRPMKSTTPPTTKMHPPAPPR